MQFNNVTLQNCVDALRSRMTQEERATADNYIFEEAVSAERTATFEVFVGDVASDQALLDRHVDYIKDNLEIDEETPDTFRLDLCPSAKIKLDEAQDLVRVEGLRGPLEEFFGFRASEGVDHLLKCYKDIREAWSDPSPDSNALLDKFLKTWNARRDERPSFSTFLDSLRDDAEHVDWQHRLRDRLGLAHYEPQPGNPIPVALMVYSVREVAAVARADAAPFACPTVLDSKPWPYYFPAPEVIPYGRAMALRTDGDEDSLQPEILHTRIEYKRSHIRALALIDRQWGPKELRNLRNHHLLKIRLALLENPSADGCPEFGEDMP